MCMRVAGQQLVLSMCVQMPCPGLKTMLQASCVSCVAVHQYAYMGCSLADQLGSAAVQV